MTFHVFPVVPGFRPFVLLLAMCLSPLAAGAGPEPKPQVAQPHKVTLEVGRSKVVKADWAVSRVSIADSEVADVQVLTPNEVLVVGKKIGITDLVLWNDQGQTWEGTVEVELDLRRFERELTDYFPSAKLSLSKSSDVVVVRGVLRRIEDSDHLNKILQNVLNDKEGKKYVNLTGVAGVQQVMLKVKVAEASRTAIRNLGIDWTNVDSGGTVRLNPNGGFQGGTVGAENINPATAISGFFPIGSSNLQILIDALADNQYLRVLAEPSLVALSGEEASFLAGGEFPIPVPQGSVGGGTGGGGASNTITIVFKEFGVRLSFRPTVLGDGKIRLRVAPEVSELSDEAAIDFQGFHVPSISTRRSETVMELGSGQSFAIAGLMRSEVKGRTKQIPAIGELPVIGALFRSVRYERGDTELLILATVELVEPLSNARSRPLPGDAHIEPSDWELYVNGQLDGKAPSTSPTQEETFHRMGLSRLQGPGAWERHGQEPARSRVLNTHPEPTPADKPARTEEGHD